ncbi:MAG: quinone-dependent dihydroorotate dehydrogenase [Ferruginibacter sp.]
MIYQIVRSILFNYDPEKVHYFSMNWMHRLCKIGLLKNAIKAMYQPVKRPPISLFGLSFPNIVGLGAGFDKNASYLNELEALGFGFIEIGTVTPKPQEGNDKPRLFRLPNDQALINRMGFNNKGVEVVAARLQSWRKINNGHSKLIIGGNIGKNKLTPNEDAWKDYEICFKALFPYVDYFVVNVSSPNTPGLRELQEKESLRKILTSLQKTGQKIAINQKPILLKIAPDLTTEQIDDVIALALEIKLDGLVVSNTSLDRSSLTPSSATLAAQMGAGGLSGLPIKKRSTEMVQYISKQTGKSLPIIASGGIFTATDAKEKLEAGASLVQVWTGFVYEGPAIVKKICAGL